MTDRADAGERNYYQRKNRNQSFGEGTPPRPATDSDTSKAARPNHPGGTDMNTVSRGAGRPAATARSNRHAQRTALPPKAGSPGAEAIAEAKAAKAETGYGSMLVGDLRKVAKGLGVEGYSRMAKGALLTAIMEMERAADKIATDGRDRAAEAFAVAEKSTTAASRAAESIGAPPVAPNKIDTRRQTDLAKMAAAAPQTKSWQKALAFRGSVAALGWSTSVDFAPDGAEDDIVEAMAQRGDEHLWISWTAGAMTLQPMPTYTIMDRTIKLKNASACLKYAGRDAKTAHDELGKVTSNKAFRRKAATPRKAHIPFDIGTTTDAEVIAALLGRTVEWHNSISGAVESGTLGRDAHRVSIQAIAEGDRIVKFCCPSTGFRAFRLSSLARVGGYSKTSVTVERKES